MARSRPQTGHHVWISRPGDPTLGMGNYVITRVFWDDSERICCLWDIWEGKPGPRISEDIMERTRKFWPNGGWLVDGDYV